MHPNEDGPANISTTDVQLKKIKPAISTAAVREKHKLDFLWRSSFIHRINHQ
jgi:hypothetical protein